MRIQSRKAAGTWSENMFIDPWTPSFATVHFGKLFVKRWWAEKLAKRTGGSVNVIKGHPDSSIRSVRRDNYGVVWSEMHRIGVDC